MFKHRITWRDLEDERLLIERREAKRRRDNRLIILFGATMYLIVCATVLWVNL